VRYPSLSLSTVAVPVIFLLLLVYVLGGELGAGISGASSGDADYINYLADAIRGSTSTTIDAAPDRVRHGMI
jgi:ABC-2 type transport system permease protein